MIQQVVAHVVQQLEVGDLALLRATTHTVAAQNPHIWSLLEAHRLYRSDLEHEEEEFPMLEDRFNLWLMILVAAHLQRIGRPQYNREQITNLLRQYNWAEHEIKKLFFGYSQRALLQPQHVADPLERPVNREDWPFWCWFGELPGLVGWLALSDVRELLTKLHAVLEDLDQTKRQEHETRTQIADLIQMLTAADQRQLGLFFDTTD